MAVIKLNEDNFQSVVLENDKTVLVDFYADWCGPCKMQAPIVEELSDELTDVVFAKLNVDEVMDIAMSYGVMSIPTIMVVKGGDVVFKEPGLMQKKELERLLK